MFICNVYYTRKKCKKKKSCIHITKQQSMIRKKENSWTELCVLEGLYTQKNDMGHIYNNFYNVTIFFIEKKIAYLLKHFILLNRRKTQMTLPAYHIDINKTRRCFNGENLYRKCVYVVCGIHAYACIRWPSIILTERNSRAAPPRRKYELRYCRICNRRNLSNTTMKSVTH